MTIQDTTRKAGPFAGNGVSNAFPFNFKVFAKTDIALTLTDGAGTVTDLVLDSDYSVTLNSDQTASPGGSILYPITGNPMPAGSTLVATGALPYTQPTDITNSGGFYPSVIEDALDRLTIQTQQLAELGTRTLHFPVTEEDADGEFPAALQRAGTVLAFDSLGNPTYPPVPAAVGAGDMYDELGSDGNMGFIAGTDFTPGVSTQITLSRAPIKAANVWMSFDGAVQTADQILSIVGKVLTLKSPPPAGFSRWYVRTGTTLSLNSPATGSVLDASVAGTTALFNRIFDPINPKDPQYGALANTVLNGSNAYVSGHNDTAAVQAAVAAAAARGGGRVELTNGIFYINNAIQLGDNVELVCKGARIFYAQTAFTYQHCVILQGKNNTVRDLHIQCDPALVRNNTGFGISVNGATDALVQGCTLNDIASAAIWVTNSTNTRVLGNRIANPKADGIHFSDASVGFVCSGNILNGTQDDAIAVVLDTVGAVMPQNGVVSANTVNGTARGHGVVFIGCTDVAIVGNSLQNIGGCSGIGNYQWNADTRKAANIHIAGNFISQVGLTEPAGLPAMNALSVHGILLGFCADTTVIGNQISDISDNAGFTSAGVLIYQANNVYVKGNVIKNCISHGVWVADFAPTSDISGIHIDGNTFANVAKYAVKANPTSVFINGLFVTENKFFQCAYDASVSNVVNLGRTQATPLRYYSNTQLNRETESPLLDSSNATDIKEASNIPAF